jgi:hypothetical protein
MARGNFEGTLRTAIAESHCESLCEQPSREAISRADCKQSLGEVISRAHCEQPLQAAIEKSHYEDLLEASGPCLRICQAPLPSFFLYLAHSIRKNPCSILHVNYPETRTIETVVAKALVRFFSVPVFQFFCLLFSVCCFVVHCLCCFLSAVFCLLSLLLSVGCLLSTVHRLLSPFGRGFYP